MKRLIPAAIGFIALFGGSTSVNAVEPFIGEIRYFGFNFCPRGWTSAGGQLLPIAQNQALFSLYGTMYGGDGRTTFGLPDLRGRFVLGPGTGPGLSPNRIGQKGGVETITLTQAQLPNHSHEVRVSGNGNKRGVEVNKKGQQGKKIKTSNSGGAQPHSNMPPYQVINACVALVGVYPSRS
ncbi:phage tail protein [Aliikangiella marina]|uniref:Phage tail protein n=1 Tax=Aliikangiella marina TaxID=1712262 RepID=A0A545TI08_9GAMM|nr:tail fiber protein [Aliikangiella marina]TQV76870.1 phage tail protein [Aliikangiella marina]